ncbi:MAG: nucleotidyltransferase domain-containing protein [Burkholderiales bacterium]
MISEIEASRDCIVELCRQYAVRRLEVFGSAATGAFDPERSDVDFLLEFDPSGDPDLFRRYFALKRALEDLLARSVDLVMSGALKNPHFIASVNASRQLVYAAPVREAA